MCGLDIQIRHLIKMISASTANLHIYGKHKSISKWFITEILKRNPWTVNTNFNLGLIIEKLHLSKNIPSKTLLWSKRIGNSLVICTQYFHLGQCICWTCVCKVNSRHVEDTVASQAETTTVPPSFFGLFSPHVWQVWPFGCAGSSHFRPQVEGLD